jgi:hypothetical protein
MSPAALVKAQSLHRFAVDQGAPLNSFQLVLTQPEAMELVEWYAKQYGGNNPVFNVDLEIVRRTGEPWDLLSNFQVMGFSMAPASLVLN